MLFLFIFLRIFQDVPYVITSDTLACAVVMGSTENTQQPPALIPTPPQKRIKQQYRRLKTKHNKWRLMKNYSGDLELAGLYRVWLQAFLLLIEVHSGLFKNMLKVNANKCMTINPVHVQ